MAEEYNPVRTATSTPGTMSILGADSSGLGLSASDPLGYSPPPTVTDTPGGTTTNFGQYDFLGGPADLSGDVVDPSTLTQTPGLPDLSSMDNAQLSSYLGSPDFTNLLSSLSGLTGGGGSKPATGTAASGGWLQNLISSLTGGAGSTGLGPYAATAGIGI